jgi:integrase
MRKPRLTRITKTTVDQAPPKTTVWDSEVRGFGVRVTAAGARSYVLQYRTVKGEQGKLTIGRYPEMTIDEARRIAREHRVSVDKGGHPSQDKKALRTAPTLADYAANYCDVYAVAKPLRPATIKEARRVLGRYALPKFGKKKVADIVSSDVRAMVAEARHGSGQGQADKLRAVLSKMFNLAIADEVRVSNPCKGVDRGPDNQRWEYLPPEHVKALLAACDGFPDRHAADAVRLLLFTGARLREVLNAEWSQFDLEGGFWTKPSSHTKQKKVHRLALETVTLALLREMKTIGHPTFLFPGRCGSKPRQDLKRPWKQLLVAAGIGHYRLHDLRRTTASFMLSTQSDLATVGKALGHTQAQTTQRYANIFQNNQRLGSERAVAAMIA